MAILFPAIPSRIPDRQLFASLRHYRQLSPHPITVNSLCTWCFFCSSFTTSDYRWRSSFFFSHPGVGLVLLRVGPPSAPRLPRHLRWQPLELAQCSVGCLGLFRSSPWPSKSTEIHNRCNYSTRFMKKTSRLILSLIRSLNFVHLPSFFCVPCR